MKNPENNFEKEERIKGIKEQMRFLRIRTRYVLSFPKALADDFTLKRNPYDDDSTPDDSTSYRSNYFHGFSIGGNIAETKDAPENSMAALELSRPLEALKSSKYVLFDVQLANDGAAVVIKDPTTGRTTEKNLAVAQTSSVELAKLNFKTGEGTVPLFKDMMDECRKKEAKVVLQVQESSQADDTQHVLEPEKRQDVACKRDT
ncbi:hypothetical protein ANCDUO_01859 [Ancylostoma duodenale]|uniref:GP-PDE domain-containing protein n=1 Tax=Ancylostoma duodenale TaxID=51022 RepID=A0A0C2H894_9BILA|nr:hypothetical protein ANCDUO_01859 [Ancylostoma duodenale]